MIVKTALAVFVALVLALAITYTVHDWFSENYGFKSKYDLFYSQDFDPNKNKIYLLGSSQVHRLNATYIEKYISQTYDNYEVYNLAVPNDQPETRFFYLEDMIDSNPVLVVYGVTFRDLKELGLYAINAADLGVVPDVIITEKPVTIMPELDKILVELVPYDDIIDFFNFDDSQQNTIGILQFLTRNDTQNIPQKIIQERTPFYNYRPDMYEISDEKALNRQLLFETAVGNVFTGYENKKENFEANDLKKIITFLQDNNLKVVLFTVPHPRMYLDTLDDSDLEIFTSVLDEISDEFDVPVYHFYDKYADLNIWDDFNHVSLHENGIIYSSDFAKIILSEIEP